MAEYIEREVALRWTPTPKSKRKYDTGNLDDAWENGYDDALRQIEAIPAADVRPVVLCRNCKWSVSTDHGDVYGCSYMHPSPNHILSVHGNFFCAYGADMRENNE